MNPFKNVDLSSVTYTNMKSNKPFLMIIGSILLIFVITLGYSIFKYMKNIINLKPYLINKPVKAFIHKEVSDTGEVSQKNPYRKVEDDVVKNTGWKGNNYSYSFWMKINDLEYNYGKPKHVFHKGPRSAETMNPGIYIHPTDNSLMIKVDNIGRFTNVNKTRTGKTCQNWTSNTPQKNAYIDFDKFPEANLGDHNYCRNPNNDSNGSWCYTLDSDVTADYCMDKDGGNLDYSVAPTLKPNDHVLNEEYVDTDSIILKDIPLQRWNHFTVVLHRNTVDIFMNGKLAKSKQFSNPIISNGDPVHMFDNGGFDGELSKLRFYPKDLSPYEINNDYITGVNSFDIAASFSKIKASIPNIDIGLNAAIDINGHKIGIPQTNVGIGSQGAKVNVGNTKLSVGGSDYASLSL